MHERLRDPQDVRPFRDELLRRQRLVSSALEADEFRDVFEVLTEHEVVAFRYDRNVANTELEQPVAAAGVVQDVDVFVIDAFTRKKLFRPKTTASPRLREQNEFFSDDIHAE
jgi:hypothetical protein